MLFRFAPDLAAEDQQGRPFPLSGLLGRYVVLYFFPKAGTPGCTQEARGFQELLEEFRKEEAEVVGISPDAPAVLARFAQKEGLEFILLSDRDGNVARAFGVWRNGRVQRATFLLDWRRALGLAQSAPARTRHRSPHRSFPPQLR